MLQTTQNKMSEANLPQTTQSTLFNDKNQHAKEAALTASGDSPTHTTKQFKHNKINGLTSIQVVILCIKMSVKGWIQARNANIINTKMSYSRHTVYIKKN